MKRMTSMLLLTLVLSSISSCGGNEPSAVTVPPPASRDRNVDFDKLAGTLECPPDTKMMAGWGKADGEISFSATCYLPHDKKSHGPAAIWYENGEKKSSTTYKNGMEHGTSLGWWPNGNRFYQAVVHNGVDDGPITIWHENGNKKAEGALVQGNKNGTWKYWREDGSMKKVSAYENGEKISTKEY